MSIDVLPSCSSASAASALFDQFSAQLASTSSSSSGHPSSPPPGRIHRNNNGPKKFDPNANADFRFVQNAVAMAVLSRLHRWCCQLFWLTIVCLIGVCSEGQKGGKDDQQFGADNKQSTNRAQTFQDVRKSIVQASQRRGCKTLHELEMQLLRHLTCPQTAVLRPLRPSQHKKRHFLSRPPSPQLFDISEEAE